MILSLPRKEEQIQVADRIIRDHLTVRQTEVLVQSLLNTNPSPSKKSKSGALSSSEWKDLEQRIQRKLGTKVRIVGTAKKGRLEIDYYTPDDLDRILEVLKISD